MTFPLDLVALFASLMWPFILCYFSTITTNRLLSLGFIAYDSNWHEYPPHLRKHIILIIKRSQKPALFSGFEIIHSTLNTFAQVIYTCFRLFCILFNLKYVVLYVLIANQIIVFVLSFVQKPFTSQSVIPQMK